MDAEVEDAFEFSQTSPFPDPSVAFADLYTEPFGPTHLSRDGVQSAEQAHAEIGV
ncbi:MAG: hypothetical protein PGN11_06870 [Quadrisphaera sp.]